MFENFKKNGYLSICGTKYGFCNFKKMVMPALIFEVLLLFIIFLFSLYSLSASPIAMINAYIVAISLVLYIVISCNLHVVYCSKNEEDMNVFINKYLKDHTKKYTKNNNNYKCESIFGFSFELKLDYEDGFYMLKEVKKY